MRAKNYFEIGRIVETGFSLALKYKIVSLQINNGNVKVAKIPLINGTSNSIFMTDGLKILIIKY